MKKLYDDSDLLRVDNNISSFINRTKIVSQDLSKFDYNYTQKHTFWTRQRKEFEQILESVRHQLTDLNYALQQNVVYTEKLIAEFRNKAKKEHLRALKNRTDSWKLEEFVTISSFKKMLEKEF